ncbi:MAG: tetratricopeptide repeat protein [Chitinophagales bacterium]|nr:tetratricopeptide repeat protein [Chitinophagales bacterium]MDW8419486.1 tetratricopeptide repeat protein [Chitinophagales bacterium]
MAKEELENQTEELENEETKTEETGSGAPKSFVDFIEQNSRLLSIAGAALALLIVGLLFFFLYYMPNRELKAQNDIYMAQFAFHADSFALALNGRNTPGATPFKGFLQVADEYSFTKTGKLARYYAGICYLRLKKYQEAIGQLEKANPKDPLVGAARLNALGDAYAGLGKLEDAVRYYEKAAGYSDNEQYTPYYLFKTGLAYEKLGKKEDALKCYQRIKDNYPNSDEGRDIQKYIARAGG